MRKNIIITILLALCLILALGWDRSVQSLKAENVIARADRDYWRVAAHYPSIPCRAKGGEYRMTGFFITFGVGTEINYACEGWKE